MRIEVRFALTLAFCITLGIGIAAYISFQLESRQAHEEVKQRADMLLETGLAVRAYTSEQITPALHDAAGTEFHVQQVPSFAAQSTIHKLQAKYPEYKYREPSLNPTNVRDRASDWEVGLLREFQNDPKRTELSGELATDSEHRFYVARPLRLKDAACLQCHSTPAAAPAAMVAKYGATNGFGWRLGDVVALQVVEVPSRPARDKAFKSVLVTVGSLASVLVLSSAVFLLLLRRHVTHPLERLTLAAHDISVNGQAGAPVAPVEGGQFRDLHDAITRLKASVDSALQRMQNAGKPNDKSDQ